MTDTVQEIGPTGCPYIGLAEDRTVMLMEASRLHHCFADPKAIEVLTVQYQTNTCLCELHGLCPRYLRAGPPVEGQVETPSRREGYDRRGGLAPQPPRHRCWSARWCRS